MGKLVEGWAKLSLERLDLIRNHIENSQSSAETELFSEFFFNNQYVPLLIKQRPQIEEEYLKSFRSLNGHRLLSKRQINIKLEKSDFSFNAFISARPNSIVTDISISCGALFALDVMAAMNVAIEFGFFPKVEKTQFSDFVREMLQNMSDIAGTTALVEFYKFTQHKDIASDHRWAVASSYSLYWLLSHEVGHYACGHIGYYQYRSTLEYDSPVAGYFSEDFNEQQFIGDIALNDAMISWCSEFMADSYATIQLMLEITHDARADKSYSQYPTVLRARGLSNNATQALNFSFIPAMVMHGERLTPFNKYGSHPSTLSRMFNISATVDFFMRPIGHTISDFRANPAREYVQPQTDAGVCQQEVFRGYWKCHKSILYFLEFCQMVSSKKPSFENLGADNIMRLTTAWMNNVFIARMGITDPILEKFSSKEYQQAIALWAGCLRLLCTNVNMRFADHIPKKWIGPSRMTQGLNINPEHAESFSIETEEKANLILEAQNTVGGFVSDPAYKILDDWMSNIFHCSKHMSKEQLEPFILQETEIAELTALDIMEG